MFEALGRFIAWYLRMFFYGVLVVCTFGLMSLCWTIITTWQLPKDTLTVLIICLGFPALLFGMWKGRSAIGFVLGGFGIAVVLAMLITAVTGNGKK